LEPAEIYFEDFSAFLFPLDATKHDFEKKKQIGRLKMCSKSIVFDHKDINKPLIKIPLKECIKISQWDEELATKYVTNIPHFMNNHIMKFNHRNVCSEVPWRSN
jgi:factor associated with neutral sphingomyelinase activation